MSDRQSERAASIRNSIRTIVAEPKDQDSVSVINGKTPAAAYAERSLGSPVSAVFATSSGDGDEVILRSSDSHDFYVNRFILKIGAPPLASLQPNEKDNVLMLPEPACILDVLLTLIYPVESPTWTSLEGFGPVLDAAIRYDMRGAIETLRQALISPRRVDDQILPSFVELDPIRAFAITRQAGLEPEAQLAGNATRSVSLRNSQLSPEVENMPTKYYRELITLRDEGGHWRETFKVFKTKGIQLKSTGRGLLRTGSMRSTMSPTIAPTSSMRAPSLFGRSRA